MAVSALSEPYRPGRKTVARKAFESFYFIKGENRLLKRVVYFALKVGVIRIDRSSIKAAAKHDGKWVLETNDDTISLEDAALGYNGGFLGW